MNLNRALLKSGKILVLTGPKGGFGSALDFFKQFKTERIAYISLNKGASSIRRALGKKRIPFRKVLVVDAVTWMKKDVPCQDNYGYYIDSQDPKKLMEFVEKFIRHNYEAVVFDSLTDLLERKKMARTERFVSEATKRLSKSKTRAIFYAENSPELASKLGKYFDKVVPISEKA